MPELDSFHLAADDRAPLPEAATALLDNPIWHSLRTEHLSISMGGEEARRFPPDIGPLTGLPRHSPENYEALRSLAGPGGVVVLFCQEPVEPPQRWSLVRDGLLSQMVYEAGELPVRRDLAAHLHLRQLGAPDAPAMVALAELTEPGPFRTRTVELGTFYGVFDGDRLVAMAGQRLRLPRHVEVSAVCTHPDARGQGLAALLMTRVMEDIRQEGKEPFLHSFAHNAPAIRVYEGLGFRLRRHLHLAVLKNEQEPDSTPPLPSK